jgi:hypothetical protein
MQTIQLDAKVLLVSQVEQSSFTQSATVPVTQSVK